MDEIVMRRRLDQRGSSSSREVDLDIANYHTYEEIMQYLLDLEGR